MKASRLAKNLEICSFKIQRIKEISEAINENLETDKLLDLFTVFLIDKLEIGQFVFYSCANKEWELLSDFGGSVIGSSRNGARATAAYAARPIRPSIS